MIVVNQASIKDSEVTVSVTSNGEEPYTTQLEYYFEPTFSKPIPTRLGDIASFHIFDNAHFDDKRYVRLRFTLT